MDVGLLRLNIANFNSHEAFGGSGAMAISDFLADRSLSDSL
jgi:hypothetical protein